MWKFALPLLLLSFSLAACGGNAADTGNAQMDYEATKKMVVDILKTDDGKAALQEMMKDEKIKQQLVMDQKIVAQTIEETLLSEKGEKFWKEAFKDPKFAGAVAKGMKKEQEELLKALMKDPEYQKMMLDIMQDPENEKNITKLLKSKEYREHLQKVMSETFESPLYKAKIQDILLKAASEQAEGEKKQEGGAQQEQQKGGGGGQ
ncbi:spore gernimation protein GerD [Bacillus aerolatus]|uniref:Spore gernimation protein GerD n=1 Tax=Bacillus aerolatus TaxID=2653354 RepID=A0A6I1FC08_9BACI|nr:spore germination lipoprotein GerD [Bacillus aerolatus]KAB7704645.1 spore gernimation protein GerD [Bacillus aerolatus]